MNILNFTLKSKFSFFSKNLLYVGLFLFFSTPAFAYLTIGESAEIMPPTEYRFGFEPQLFLNEGGGANVGAFFESNISESSSARFGLTSGKVDFSMFGSYKYVPFPDVDRQPALGVRVGAGYARLSSENLVLVQVAPLVSKKTQPVEKLGDVVPYFSLPFTLTSGKSESFVASNLTFGIEVNPHSDHVFYWSVEASFNLSKSYSYISGCLTIPIDSHRGGQ